MQDLDASPRPCPSISTNTRQNRQTPATSEDESASNLAHSMYSSASNNNNYSSISENVAAHIYLVSINNEKEEEYSNFEEMFHTIFENDGSEIQRSAMKDIIRTKCNEEFKTLSLHVCLKNRAEINASVRLKGTASMFFDSSEDAREYVGALEDNAKENMVVEALKVRYYNCLVLLKSIQCMNAFSLFTFNTH